jgi:hypothetical protein
MEIGVNHQRAANRLVSSLACSVEKTKGIGIVSDHDSDSVIIEYLYYHYC